MATQLAMFVPARARRSDPITSHRAAAKFPESVLTELQRQVYGWLFTQLGGATAEELERNFPNAERYSSSTLRKRLSELKELGLIRDSGKKRENSRKSAHMIVWEVTTAK